MDREKYRFLPEVNGRSDPPAPEVRGDSPCPCCGSITIPNGGDALAYICPVCMWEIDLFITGPDEPSDQNQGLTLNQAKEILEQRRRNDPQQQRRDAAGGDTGNMDLLPVLEQGHSQTDPVGASVAVPLENQHVAPAAAVPPEDAFLFQGGGGAATLDAVNDPFPQLVKAAPMFSAV